MNKLLNFGNLKHMVYIRWKNKNSVKDFAINQLSSLCRIFREKIAMHNKGLEKQIPTLLGMCRVQARYVRDPAL